MGIGTPFQRTKLKDIMNNDESLAARLARAEEEDRLDTAWLAECLRIQAAESQTKNPVERLMAVMPKLPPRPTGYELRQRVCNRCGQPTELNWDYDARFCRRCNRWIESACGDVNCPYCADRPAKPLP